MWFLKLIVSFFFSIDKIIYGFISTIYDLLITISRTTILSQSQINEFYQKVYMLLGIFMLFKVGFSLITYVVNPDDFSDKNKGIGKIGQNVIISLCMLVLVPYAFNMAYDLQRIILEDNILANVILGKSDGDTDINYINTAGDTMAFTVLNAFVTPNTSLEKLNECINIWSGDNLNPDCFGYNLKDDGTFEESGKENNTMRGYQKDIKDTNGIIIKNYMAGLKNENVGLMFRLNLLKATVKENSEEKFLIEYRYIFSTVTGVVVVLILLGFCLDVALRSVKLAFLQMIAPIPIISYIDPKSGKDGIFKKWYKMCFSTFLSLFVRLLALYFGIYIISKVTTMTDIITGSTVTNGFVRIFIIIGVLMFAKQLPKILEGLGIKIDGDGKFNLNPLRKIENEAMGGKVLKKPNDLIGKAGKAALFAPAIGAGLLGKKTIGGIDAARNGKGFKQGWDRTHGKLHNNFYKKLDEWAPDSAEARKNERAGREEVAAMHNKWTKGKEAADKLKQYNPSDPWGALDGSNEGAYNSVYENKEFIQSRMNLDKADAKNKILQRISEQTMRGSTVAQALEAEKNNIKKLDETSQKDLFGMAGLQLDVTGDNLVKKPNTNVSDASATANFTEMLDKTSKAVGGMEKVHESIRKQNPNDAATEDALKHVKYNKTDPTDTSRRYS